MRNDLTARLRLALVAGCLTVGAALHAQTADKAPATPATPAAPPAPPAVNVADQVGWAFRMGDLPELERLHAIYGQPGIRSPETGVPRIEQFWEGISEVSSDRIKVTEAYYTQLDAMTRRWAEEYPDSALAQLLYAHALKTHAWFIRGSDVANTVSPESWAGFKKYLALSLVQLKRAEKLAARDSAWNHLMLVVGRGLGWSNAQLLAVFEDGLAKNPDHDALYVTMQTALLPKWGGDLPTVERFIASMDRRNRERSGMHLYALLYAELSDGEVKQQLFEVTRASWLLMRAGFDERVKRYPHALNHNRFAYFACMAKDTEVLREQLRLMGDAFDRAQWGTNPTRNFETCKATAAKL